MGGSGWLMMIGFWLLVVLALIGAAAWIFPRRAHEGVIPRELNAREILDQRLARREVDVETYRMIRDELSRPAPTRTEPTGAEPHRVVTQRL